MTHPGGGAGSGPGGGAGSGPGRQIETFHFGDTPLRTVTVGGEPWFVVADACRALDLANPTMAANRLDPYDLSTAEVIDGMGRRQQARIANESGLYELIFQSRKPEAKAFRRWITHDVLPAIRRTGRYEVARSIPQTYADALRLAADEHERAERVTRELEAVAPKAHSWDVLASAHGDYSVREAAFILNRDPSISTGQQRLFQLLRDWRLIDSRDIPYAAHETHVRLRPRSYEHPKTREEISAKPQVRITYEGLRYLHRRMGGTAPLSVGQQVAS